MHAKRTFQTQTKMHANSQEDETQVLIHKKNNNLNCYLTLIDIKSKRLRRQTGVDPPINTACYIRYRCTLGCLHGLQSRLPIVSFVLFFIFMPKFKNQISNSCSQNFNFFIAPAASCAIQGMIMLVGLSVCPSHTSSFCL